jgi:hypothetical protein
MCYLALKLIFSISYLLIILGSLGMMFFATKFPFCTRIRDLEGESERLIGLNGFQVWKYSWIAIIIGTIMQLINFWLS